MQIPSLPITQSCYWTTRRHPSRSGCSGPTERCCSECKAVTYQVPEDPPNMWGHRARRTNQSIKKPIESLLIILRPFLNALMLAESITCCELFHRSMTRSEKMKRLRSNEQRFYRTLAEWPLVLLSWLSLKYRQNGVSDSPLYIWKTYSKSALLRPSVEARKLV